ncbi:hypothetical protein Tco_1096394 [Tanacetum coccineum]
MTWVNIIGVPVSCWSEVVFRKIAAVHGAVVGTDNCKMEGNQNNIIGRVQIHTCVNGLINESLRIRFRGVFFKVTVIEEIRDICDIELEDVNKAKYEEHINMGSAQRKRDDDMVVSDEEDNDGSSEDSNGEEGDSDDDKEENGDDKDGRGMEFRPVDTANLNSGEEEGSRVSRVSRSRVSDSAEEGDESPNENILEEELFKKRRSWMKELAVLGKRKKSNAKMVVRDNSGLMDNMDNLAQNNYIGGPNVQLRNENNNVSIANENGRGDLSPNPNSSGGDRRRKKRKSNDNDDCERLNCENVFTPGVGDEDNNKKKIRRKSVKKAMDAMRHIEVDGLGDENKGISDIHKVVHDKGGEKGGVFVFRGKESVEPDSKSCSISLEHVKEVGEMIGVSWAKAEEEKIREDADSNELQ